jgi:hypothetical protein
MAGDIQPLRLVSLSSMEGGDHKTKTQLLVVTAVVKYA